MKTTLPVALIQERNHGDAEANLAVIEQRVAEAAKQGAKLVLLQELHNGAYFCQHESVSTSSTWPNRSPARAPSAWASSRSSTAWCWSARCSSAARAGLYHNTAVVFDADGSTAGKYRKMHIPDDPGFYEKFYFTPGDLGFHPIDTSVGRLGVLVCWDQWYPEGARLMALAGAELLLYPTAIGWDPDDDQAEKDRQRNAWILSHRGHAVANGLPVLSCNRVGHEPSPLGAAGHRLLGLQPRARPAGRVPGRGRQDEPGNPDGRSRPAAQRARAPDLAVPARPPHRCLRRPAQALPGLTPDVGADRRAVN